jgi:hypothetical protein
VTGWGGGLNDFAAAALCDKSAEGETKSCGVTGGGGACAAGGKPGGSAAVDGAGAGWSSARGAVVREDILTLCPAEYVYM